MEAHYGIQASRKAAIRLEARRAEYCANIVRANHSSDSKSAAGVRLPKCRDRQTCSDESARLSRKRGASLDYLALDEEIIGAANTSDQGAVATLEQLAEV